MVGTVRYRIRRGIPIGSPTLLSVALGTPAVVASAVDPPFREPTNAGAVVLADGSPAAIWTTTGTWVRDERLHFAADGATPPATQPTPRVTIGRSLDRVLERFDSSEAAVALQRGVRGPRRRARDARARDRSASPVPSGRS